MTDRLGPYLLGPNDTLENGIYTGDAAELIDALPSDCIDLLVTDPPYFLPVQTYVGVRGKGYVRRALGDASILEMAFRLMFSKTDRILKPTGTTYVFCNGQSYPTFYRAMFPFFKYVRPLIWDKAVSYNGYTWRHQHEMIAWGERQDAERVPTGDGDILICRGVLQKDRLHPAQKPVELLAKLIQKHEEATVIADWFGGSGSVAVAAKMLGRRYLAFEIDPDVAETARERVRNTQMPLFVLGPEQSKMEIGGKEDVCYAKATVYEQEATLRDIQEG